MIFRNDTQSQYQEAQYHTPQLQLTSVYLLKIKIRRVEAT